MATLNTSSKFDVNIAGDYSARGLDIEPNEPYISREDIRSNGNGGIQFEDEVSAESRRMDEEHATRESLRSATGQSTLGQEAGKKLVNPANGGVNADWPVDE